MLISRYLGREEKKIAYLIMKRCYWPAGNRVDKAVGVNQRGKDTGPKVRKLKCCRADAELREMFWVGDSSRFASIYASVASDEDLRSWVFLQVGQL